MQYIYLVHQKEFSSINEPTYTVGKAYQSYVSKITGVPKDSDVIVFQQVRDNEACERALIFSLKDAFQIHTKGPEFIIGDVDEIQKALLEIIMRIEYT